MVQDARGVMYFATKSGILEFDGRNWDILKGNSAVYALDINASGEIYWSGANGFGRITYDDDGFQHLQLLSDSTISDVFQNLSVGNEVFFLREDGLFIYNTTSQRTAQVKCPAATGYFTSMFELFGSVYVNTGEAGIFRLEGDKFVQGNLNVQGEISFYSRIDDTYVLGTADNHVLVCDEDLNIKPIVLKDQEYANASVIIYGNWINRQLLALGTLRGGVMFVNPITGTTEEIINYETGLPDNEVFALTTDHNKDVWVAHDYGFTKVSPYMPLRSFSHYNGLEGNLLCALSSNKNAYVGTSLGLYKLQKEDVYDELVYFVDVEIPPAGAKQVNNKPEEETKQADGEGVESKKKGLFNFLRRNRKKDRESEPVANVVADVVNKDKATTSTTPKFRREKKTKKILRASQSVYRKVDGADSKISMLLEVEGSLIAAGLSGVFEINDLTSHVILEEPVRYIYASPFHRILFAATYNNEIKALIKDKKGWQLLSFLDNLDDQIDYIFEGDQNEMFICGLDNIYQLTIKEQKVESIRNIEVPNPDVEATLGMSDEGSIMFVNGSGFYNLNRQSGKVLRLDSLATPEKYFASEGKIFYRNDHGWQVRGQETRESNLQLLNLFPDLRYITTDKHSGDFWMISGSSDLYKFYSDRLATDQKLFPVFLKSITNNNKKIGRQNNIHFSEDKSAVTFEIVQPDFISPEAVEFRFNLKGMSEAWSDWTSKNTFNFPYLPPGEYVLYVESRNVFGKVMELEPLHFEVLPPYWKRLWFYAMEFAVLVSLVLLSHRLNNRYRIVSRVLSLLTIILLIQFMQTFIDTTIKFGEESPVIHFIIQVCVALLILPVEGFLRNLMFGSLEGSGIVAKLLRRRVSGNAVVKDFQPDEDPVNFS